LGEPGTFPAQAPLKPSVFGGDGKEQRKAMRFSLDQDVLDVTKGFDQKVQTQMPWKNNGWNSCVADATEQYNGALKAKIWVTGPKACVVRDEYGKVIAMPGQPWPRPRADARIIVKGVYRQSTTSSSLILNVTHLHLSGNHQENDEPDPFRT
jgi:hypothetical protein